MGDHGDDVELRSLKTGKGEEEEEEEEEEEGEGIEGREERRGPSLHLTHGQASQDTELVERDGGWEEEEVHVSQEPENLPLARNIPAWSQGELDPLGRGGEGFGGGMGGQGL